MKIDELRQEIAGQKLAPIYLVLGTEQYLQNQVKQLFQNYLSPEEKTMNFASYDMLTTTVAVALDDAQSTPFFGERRLVCLTSPYFLTGETVKDKLDHDLTGLLAYLTQPVVTTTLIIFAPYVKLDERKKLVKTLKKVAKIVDCSQLNEKAAQHNVQRSLAEKQYQIEPQALTALTQRTGADYSEMMAQLPKLMLFALQTHEITESSVENLVTQQLEDNVFDLVSAVLSRNADLALTRYQDLLLQQEEPIKINAILLGQFRLLLQVKLLLEKGYTQGNLASFLKVHPYRIKLAIQQVKHFSKKDLEAAYLGLEATELSMKTGRMDKSLAFELFVLKFSANQLTAAVD